MPDDKLTILVKKSDGSQVRMTMAEFKLYKEQRALEHPSTPAPIENVAKVEEVKNPARQASQLAGVAGGDLPMKIQSEALATTTPVREIFIDEATASQKSLKSIKSIKSTGNILQKSEINWTAEDQKSPLEETIDLSKNSNLPNLQNSVDINQILKKIKFPIKESLMGRFISLITSALKGVRTEEQVLNYSLKAEATGGLGLTLGNAEELVQVLFPKKHFLEDRKEKLSASVANKEEIIENKTAFETDLLAKGQRVENLKINNLEQTVAKPKLADNRPEVAFSGSLKPILHDVITPVIPKKSLGPEDELRNFTLTDFRRLSPNTVQAGKILEQKFLTIKADSYLWYLGAVEAWRESPLYQKYLQIIRQSLIQNKKISEYLQTTRNLEQLKEEEFRAVIGVNQSLHT